MNAIKTPFDPLATALKTVRPPTAKELPIETHRISASVAVSPTPRLAATDHFKILVQCPFEDLSSLKKWEEKIFKGGTEYKVFQEKGSGFLKSKSVDSCSGLYIRAVTPVTPDLYVSWKWRVMVFPKKKTPDNLSNKSEDDFAARIYVIFPGANFFKSDVIEYIWDERVPIGTTASSPYSERVKLFVLKSGPFSAAPSGWIQEERNVYEDYQKLYGRAPEKPVGAIALMSDSDNTGTSAEADFADLCLKIKLKS